MVADGNTPPPPSGLRKGPPKQKGLPVTVILGAVIAGVVLMLVGGLLGHLMDQVTQYPEIDDEKYDPNFDGIPDEDMDVIREDQDSYEDRRTLDRALENVGIYFYIIGLVILIIGLLLGAILCPALPDMVRLGMVVAVGFLVYVWV